MVHGHESGGCDFFLCYMLKSWDMINNIIIIKNKKGWKIGCKFVDNPTYIYFFIYFLFKKKIDHIGCQNKFDFLNQVK